MKRQTAIYSSAPPDALMLPVQAAEYLTLSLGRLAKMRVLATGPKYYKIGRSVRYRRSDLDAWLWDRRQASTKEP